jgi:hypothetical protein
VGKAFLANIAPRADLVINLMEMEEWIVQLFDSAESARADKPDRGEKNYIHQLPLLPTQERVQMDREEVFRGRNAKIAQSGFCSVEFLCQTRVIHLDGLKDGEIAPLSEISRLKLLREVKNHLRIAQSVAKTKNRSVDELHIAVHCRKAMNRTPFYIALFSFMLNPDWVRGKDDREIVNTFLELVQQLGRTPRPARDALALRMPHPSHFREFCRPEFLQALRDVVGQSDPLSPPAAFATP